MPTSAAVDEAPGQRARMTSELGNHRAGFIAHGDVVDAAALAALAFLGFGHEAHAEPARRDVGDRAMLCHRRLPCELQAKANALSASVKMNPPWQDP